MRHVILAVKDLAMQSFEQPFAARAEGVATRSFQDAINADQKGPLQTHPEDFELWVIGDFDDNTGKLTAPAEPFQLARAKDLVIPKPAPTIDTSSIVNQVLTLQAQIGGLIRMATEATKETKSSFLQMFKKGN